MSVIFDHFFITDQPLVLSFTPSSNTTVMEGDTLTLNCTYEGNPSPSVSWTHNGTTLDTSNDLNLTEPLTSYGYALLEVTLADINDTGSYACHANNNIGNDDSNEILINIIEGILYKINLIEIVLVLV